MGRAGGHLHCCASSQLRSRYNGAKNARESPRVGRFFGVTEFWCVKYCPEIQNFCRKSLLSTWKIPVLWSREAETGSTLNCARDSAVKVQLKLSAFGGIADMTYCSANVCF